MSISHDQEPARRDDSQRIQAANLDVVDEANASAEVRLLYQQFRDDFGRPQVPGILQCFATHPPLLAHVMGMAKSMLFLDGALGRRHKEMISTFVSATNQCSYCTDSHAHSFRMQGGTAPALDAVLACDPEAQSLAVEERTLLRFVKKITEDSQAILPGDIEAMRANGFSDLQIAEAIHVTALFATFNRVVSAFGLPSQELMKQFEPRRDEGEDVAHA